MAEPTGDSEPQDTTVEDTKAKMRAALDRKKEQQHHSTERARSTGSVHGPEVAGGAGQRRFRRKSG